MVIVCHNVDVMDVLWSLYAIMLMLWMSYGHFMAPL